MVGAAGSLNCAIKSIYGRNNKEINRCSDQQKRHSSINEIADREKGLANLETDGGEVWLADDGRNERSKQVFRQGGDNLPKAAPITTPTAISTTLPRRMNFLKPESIVFSLCQRPKL